VIQVVARRCDRRIMRLSTAWPGNRNDIIAARAEASTLLAGAPHQVLADGAYRSLPGVISPAWDTTSRIIRDHAWALHRRRRATAEHVSPGGAGPAHDCLGRRPGTRPSPSRGCRGTVARQRRMDQLPLAEGSGVWLPGCGTLGAGLLGGWLLGAGLLGGGPSMATPPVRRSDRLPAASNARTEMTNMPYRGMRATATVGAVVVAISAFCRNTS
jgi:hypothetical protein